MKKILNYTCSDHFLEQVNLRRIDDFLISLCLAKGKETIKRKRRIIFEIDLKIMDDAVKQGYLDCGSYIGVEKLSIVAERGRLITAFMKYSDEGLSNFIKN